MSEQGKGKGKLAFQLRLPDRLGKAALPIEVRAADRKLVGRFDASEEPSVQAGSYLVSVRMPGGEELADWVDVAPGTTAHAVFATADAEDHDSLVSKYVLAPRRSPLSSAPRSSEMQAQLSGESLERLKTRRSIDPALPVGIRAWEGTIGAFHPLPLGAFRAESRRGITRLTLPSSMSNAQCLIQLLVPGRPGVVIVAPRRPHGPPCTLAVLRVGDELSLDAHLENEIADVMIRDATEIERTARAASALDARDLMQAKSNDPIAAAAGAIALLGIDQADQIHSWLRNLAEWFPWLPDGAAAAAESSARLGQHRDAVEMLMLLSARGIPLFSDALAWALDRLGRYERSSEPMGDRAAIRALRQRLQPFAELGVSGRPLTTFRALDPNEPDDEPCSTIPPGAQLIDNLMTSA
jgi:hypothetical protein